MTSDSKAVCGGGEAVTLAECPVGLFVSESGTLGLKTEYHGVGGATDCYIVETGEFFWGSGNGTPGGQAAQKVRPIPYAVAAALASTAGAGAEPQVVRDIARMVGEKAEEIRLVIDRHTSPRGPGIYMASKTAHAPEWRRLRAEGLPIISTWIDEAGKGETACFTDLWQRCVDEAATASVVIVYRQPGEVLKGAFVEAGAALACGVPVLAVGCDEFSFSNHDGVERLGTLHAALDRARQILVELPATEAPAAPASPRSGAGEGEVRQAAERLLDGYRGLETILAGMDADIPDGARVVVRVGPRYGAHDLATYGAFRSLDHALKGLPASPPAPAEHAVEIRERIAQIIHDHTHQQQGVLPWAELAKLGPAPQGYCERRAYALADKLISALSQGGGAGRSERAVEIRELHAALSKGHALLCESGPDRCWVKIGFGWLQDAQDAHGALARFIKAAAPAQSPSTSDAEG